MPTFPPRVESRRKKENLKKALKELKSVIKKELPTEKVAEKYRLAQMGLLKAKLHERKEREFEDKKTNLNEANILSAITIWKIKPLNDIVNEVKEAISLN